MAETEFRLLRTAAGWAVEDVAALLKRSKRYMQELDCGDHQPHDHTIALLRILADKRCPEWVKEKIK